MAGSRRSLELSNNVAARVSYPAITHGPVGSVDKIRLERVVNVMQQFIGFPQFDIDSMLMNGG